jgi:pimeloyl-ACP methyl ester carboxylesterase
MKTRLSRPVSLCILLVSCMAVWAQSPPYDVFPAADPPYYRVRYEPSKQTGELIYGVNFTLWIPPEVKQLRGIIVHQHGCGEGSCKSGLTGAYDLHWQALARKHRCALLAPAYEQPEKADCQMWCDPRNGSDQAFQRCLVDFAAMTGHPELPIVPWALWGHSGGGHWAGGMVMLHPDRVVAAWLRSGVPILSPDPDRGNIHAHELPQAALSVPMMCNLGTKEGVTVQDERFAGVWPAHEKFFLQVRGQGGLVGVAVDPLSSHECGNQRFLAIPWLDACLEARLPDQVGKPLRSMHPDTAWLAEPTGSKASQASGYEHDPHAAGWLPNESIAQRWMEYVVDTHVTDTTPPPPPTEVSLAGKILRWKGEADLESGLSYFLIERDGVVIGTWPEKPANPFGRPLFQNLQYSDTPPQPLIAMEYTVPASDFRSESEYQIRSVNTLGLSSDAVQADRIR